MGVFGKIRRRLAGYATFRAWDVTYLYVHDLAAIASLEVDKDCTVRRLKLDEIDILRGAFPLNIKEMQARVRRGHGCYAAFLDQRIANYGWVQTQGWHYLRDAGRWRRLREQELYIYHCRTADWARGRRIYPIVLTRILDHHRQQGFSRAWIYTGQTNLPSQRGIERAGFVLKQLLPAMRLGPIVIPLPGARNVGP